MMPAALIFDVDGTLADTEEAHRQAFNGAFARHGHAWQWSRETYRDLLRVTGGKERIAHFVRALGLDPLRTDECLAEIPALHCTKTALYTHHVAAGRVPLRSGVQRLLIEARAAGIRLAIATTTSLDNVTALLAATLGPDLQDAFEVIVAGDAVAAKKPAPDAYRSALKALDLPAEACLAFEDSRNGLRAAVGAGLRTVVTPTLWTREDDLSEAWLVLPELGDPDHPLRNPPAPLARPWLRIADLPELLDATA